MDIEFSLVVPTYKERDNIDKLVTDTHNALAPSGISYELIIVDDNSPDGTAERARELAMDFPVVVHPGYPEGNQPLGFHHAQQDVLPAVNFLFGDVGNNRFGYFLNGLDEFRLVPVPGGNLLHKGINFVFIISHMINF